MRLVAAGKAAQLSGKLVNFLENLKSTNQHHEMCTKLQYLIKTSDEDVFRTTCDENLLQPPLVSRGTVDVLGCQ